MSKYTTHCSVILECRDHKCTATFLWFTVYNTSTSIHQSPQQTRPLWQLTPTVLKHFPNKNVKGTMTSLALCIINTQVSKQVWYKYDSHREMFTEYSENCTMMSSAKRKSHKIKSNWTVKFSLLNSYLIAGNSQSWPRALNCMAPDGMSFTVYRWLRPLQQLWWKQSYWAFTA